MKKNANENYLEQMVQGAEESLKYAMRKRDPYGSSRFTSLQDVLTRSARELNEGVMFARKGLLRAYAGRDLTVADDHARLSSLDSHYLGMCQYSVPYCRGSEIAYYVVCLDTEARVVVRPSVPTDIAQKEDFSGIHFLENRYLREDAAKGVHYGHQVLEYKGDSLQHSPVSALLKGEAPQREIRLTQSPMSGLWATDGQSGWGDD